MSELYTLHRGVHGKMDEALLERSEGALENDNERTTWVEYRCRCHGDVVKRSAHITLLRAPSLFGEPGGIG